MQHQIYPDRFNDDGEFVPAVIVEVPDILYLQVVDEGDCEDWPAPSEPSERTFTTERLNASDVAYVPAARAERAEAEAEALRAQLDTAQEAAHMPDDWPHGLPSWIAQRLYAAYIGAVFAPEVMEQIAAGRLAFPEAPIYAERAALRAQLDAARWQPMTIPLPVTNIDVELLVKGRVNEQGLWLFRDISPVIGWRPLPAAPGDEEARP